METNQKEVLRPYQGEFPEIISPRFQAERKFKHKTPPTHSSGTPTEKFTRREDKHCQKPRKQRKAPIKQGSDSTLVMEPNFSGFHIHDIHLMGKYEAECEEKTIFIENQHRLCKDISNPSLNKFYMDKKDGEEKENVGLSLDFNARSLQRGTKNSCLSSNLLKRKRTLLDKIAEFRQEHASTTAGTVSDSPSSEQKDSEEKQDIEEINKGNSEKTESMSAHKSEEFSIAREGLSPKNSCEGSSAKRASNLTLSHVFPHLKILKTSPSRKNLQISEKQLERERYQSSVLSTAEVNMIDYSSFLLQAPPPGKTYQMTLVREKEGIARSFFPAFKLFFSDNMSLALAWATKTAEKKESAYKIAAQGNLDCPRWSLGSNFLGTEFTLYEHCERSKNPFKKEHVYIAYEKNFFGMKGPRKFSLAIPQPAEKSSTELSLFEKGSSLRSMFKQKSEAIKIFSNQAPRWSEHHEAYVLDFYNRVEQASVKNFQFSTTSAGGREILLQFGKVRDNVFNLDVRWPFTPLQALGIALSSCDSKLFCE